MRKIFAVVIIAATLLSLFSGCGKKELEPIEKAQAKAVEIGEQYLNFEITGKEAEEMLDSIKVPETEGTGQLELSADIAALSFSISLPSTSYDAIQRRVEMIAKHDYTD